MTTVKHIVVNDEFLVADIKPRELIAEYRHLVRREMEALSERPELLKSVGCPCCSAEIRRDAFGRFGLSYGACVSCGTLYVSPRPDDAWLRNHYRNSESRRYWSDVLAARTSGQRRSRIIAPRFEWVSDSVAAYGSGFGVIADVNTSQPEVLQALLGTGFSRKVLVDPLHPADPGEVDGPECLDDALTDLELDAELDALTLFEVIDHTADVRSLLARAWGALKPGGLLFVTAIVSSGFDVLLLWDRLDSLIPPDRLNTCSVKGLRGLMEDAGFECLEVSTPGILDVANVKDVAERDSSLELSRFERYLVQSGFAHDHRALQDFLQAELLSSYCRMVLRRPRH